MINIVKYHEDYDSVLKQFEQSSAAEIGEEFPYTLIKSSTKFNFRFSSKYETYSEYEIILGLDKKTSEVLATAIFSTKTVSLNEIDTKIVQILVIKVHPEVRHLGIGSKLLRFIQKQSVNKGVPVLVAKLNYGSSFAYKLFIDKFSFSEASCVKMTIISDPEICENVLSVDKEKALKMISEFYRKKDGFPLDFEKIFESKAYLGTFMLMKGEEYVAASVWNVSFFSDVRISQVVLDESFLIDNKKYSAAWACMMLCVFGFFFVWKWVYDYFEDKAYKITAFILFLFFGFYLCQWIFVISKYLRQLRALPKPRLRIFGVTYNNSLEPKKSLLTSLFNHLATLYPNEYTSFEFHEDDIFNSIFPLYSFRKQFIQKNLQNSIVFKWTKRHFIDPRE